MQSGTPAPQSHVRRARRHVRTSAPRSRWLRAAAGLSGLLRRVPARWRLRDAGMATAEYAIATLAACGFAALLLALLRSGEVRGLLFGIIRKALAVG
jgi:hypothetical protein